ncbi:MAG: metal-dependent transcriptional regulator [Chloroflexi bacterium]|nr:metal-dependent transcriptional regulator [Chloroflexota bacterium]
MTSPVVEDYLQHIHFMTRDGVPVIAARLAERLRVTPPTVTATLQRMERDGLIEHQSRKSIAFTEAGRRMAEDTVRRHALAERLLTDLLHMGWHEAHEEAHGVEHALTPKIETHLLAALGHPTTCPHGNPIPGLGRLNPDEIPLDRLAAGDDIVIQRITEEAEEDLGLMRYLQEHGVAPGATMHVRELTPFNGLIVLEGASGQVPLGLAVASKLRARRLADAAVAA